LRPGRRRNRTNRRIGLGGHNGRGLFACRAKTISILPLKNSANAVFVAHRKSLSTEGFRNGRR
jgi:hypothetical protein